MTNRPTLPPQAYTREMLSTAFQWLQSQPESIKKLAHTPDALVGLYLRAQKFGHTSPEADAPVSSQAFVADLKNLAEGLKQFEEPKAAVRAPQPSQQLGFAQRIRTESLNVAAPMAATAAAFAGASATPYPATQQTYEAPAQMPVNHPQVNNQINVQMPAQMSGQMSPPNYTPGLNPMTQSMIQEVKHHLNLSSDAEVINMMVALAYKNVKGLLA